MISARRIGRGSTTQCRSCSIEHSRRCARPPPPHDRPAASGAPSSQSRMSFLTPLPNRWRTDFRTRRHEPCGTECLAAPTTFAPTCRPKGVLGHPASLVFNRRQAKRTCRIRRRRPASRSSASARGESASRVQDARGNDAQYENCCRHWSTANCTVKTVRTHRGLLPLAR